MYMYKTIAVMAELLS